MVSPLSRPASGLLTVILTAGLPLSLFAQSGDRPNDPQQPPPAHWDIPPAPALTVAEAMETFEVAPGFRIEVVAAEPLLFDPVAMEIGPDGRIWVVEMRGYMPNVDGEGENAPIGTVAVLADTDGDGRMDKRTEFAGGLVMPRALALVDDGLLVAAPPMLWHFRDTDGDDIADERTVVSETYGDRKSPEHTANGLLWGLDNWIYNANDNERYRWSQGEWTTSSAPDRGQWGLAQDDTGRLLYNTNSSPLKMDVFPGEYLLRNPALHSHRAINRETIKNNDLAIFPSRITPGVNRGYKILTPDGYLPNMTAASGPIVYRGSLFPETFYGDAFIPEPAGNLIKRLKIAPTSGGALEGSNAYDHFDFLTSTDERFRPVNLYNGPDGGLYIVDMYRGIIQHRIFVTSFLRAQIIERGLETPLGMGRIYRVVPTKTAAVTTTPNLHTATTAELVDALNRRDAWWRETAQRLLVEQRDATAAPALQKIASDPTSPGQLNALWTLHGIGELDASRFWKLAADTSSATRIALLQISEAWLAKSDPAFVAHAVSELEASDPSIRRQAVLSLGELPGADRIAPLAAFVSQGMQAEAIDEALVSGISGHEIEFLKRLAHPLHTGAKSTVRLAIETIVNRGDAAEVTSALDLLLAPAHDPAFTRAILAGFDSHTRGKGDDRRRLKLPVEPTALVKLADNENLALAHPAKDLLKFVDGPTAQAAGPKTIPLTDAEQIRYDQGKNIYALCAGCHQADGRGMNGLAPSLIDSPWATGPAEIAVAIVLKGKEGDQLAMPPLGTLDDNSIAAALTYVRRSFGHTASAVAPEEVAAARKKYAHRTGAWNEPDLKKLSKTLNP